VVTGLPLVRGAGLLDDVAAHVLHAIAPLPGEQVQPVGGPLIEPPVRGALPVQVASLPTQERVRLAHGSAPAISPKFSDTSVAPWAYAPATTSTIMRSCTPPGARGSALRRATARVLAGGERPRRHAALAAGPAFACKGGACGTCRAKVIEGKLDMR
jgi:hypothetical protein